VELDVYDLPGLRVAEGPPGQPLMRQVSAVISILEVCFEHRARALILYPENLTERFFDLSSGEAGEVLQKLRNFNIRLAVIGSPELRLSSRFGELLADEQRGPYFRLLDTRAAAQEWLAAS